MPTITIYQHLALYTHIYHCALYTHIYTLMMHTYIRIYTHAYIQACVVVPLIDMRTMDANEYAVHKEYKICSESSSANLRYCLSVCLSVLSVRAQGVQDLLGIIIC